MTVPRRLGIDDMRCLVYESPLYVLFRYTSHLTEAKRFGIRKSRASGLGLGCVYVTMFSAYGLAFWFGAKMVADGDMTAGGMITVKYSDGVTHRHCRHVSRSHKGQ